MAKLIDFTNQCGALIRMLASETVTSHQDGPLNQIPDKAASKPGAGLASHKSERATMEAFPKIRNQCSVAVNIECKKGKIQKQRKEDMA